MTTPDKVAVVTGGVRGIGLNGLVLAVDGGFDATGVGLPTLRRTADPAGA
jgi:NAD(P)-dependent dehydrogenase (short-subunit alcohol dehydrogenase family)